MTAELALLAFVFLGPLFCAVAMIALAAYRRALGLPVHDASEKCVDERCPCNRTH